MATLKSSDILAELKKSGRLPEISHTLSAFEAAWKNPSKHIQELGQIVEKDAGVSKRVVDTANSVLYRGETNVSNVGHAVGRLGVIETRNIVHAISLHSAFTSPLIDPRKFWRHSITAAFSAKHLADYMNKRFSWKVDPATAFLAGLLHEAGSVLMARHFMKHYDKLREESTSLDAFIDNESKFLHMNHAVLGAALFKSWDLPHEVVMAVAGHHHPARIHEDHYQIAYVTCLAEGASWLIGEGNGFIEADTNQTSQHLIENLEREKLTRDHLAFLAKQAQADSESSNMLGMF
jgi:putative nucleotidyltransferase with HDIG domain